MSRLPTYAYALARVGRLVVGLLAPALVVVVAGACSQQLPVAQEGALAASDRPWAANDRPVSETCRALSKPPLPVAPQARIAYESLTSASLKGLVDIVAHDGRL